MSTPTAERAAPLDPTPAAPADARFPDLEEELAMTRVLLERYPEAHADWRPHPKSMTLAMLAAHVAELPELGRMIVATDEWDGAAQPYVAPTCRTRDEILAFFDASAVACRTALAAMTDADLARRWRMFAGDVEYFAGRRDYLVRRYLLGHLAHHRGQLGVYYRLLDVPVPGMYGPSADDLGG